jgi:hypothetical protein
MSIEENNDEIIEEKKIITKLRNTVNDTEIPIETTEEGAKALKELLSMQNEQNNSILKENTLLKQKLAVNDLDVDDSHKAPQGGNTAPLNDQQIYGQIKSKVPSAKIQKIIDDVTPIGLKEYDNLQEMFEDLNKRANRNEKTDTIDENANKILNELTYKAIKGHHERQLVDFSIDPKELSEFHHKQSNELRKYVKKVD